MEKAKMIASSIMGIISSWLGILAIPMYILVLLNIVDYATAIAAAPYRCEKINSYKGFRGIAKKICMWLLVAIGAVIDWLVSYTAVNVGIQFNLAFLVASVVAIWLICNEIISILENMIDIGVKMPKFLYRFALKIRDTIEQQNGEM